MVDDVGKCIALAAQAAAPLERQLSRRAVAGGGGAIIIPDVHYAGPAGTALHQPMKLGYTEGPPHDPVDPVREGFIFKPKR